MKSFLKKRRSYDERVLFRRGIKLSWFIFFLSFIFFAAWWIGHKREYIMVPNTSSFSRFFFYLNPNIFGKIFLEGNILAFFKGASTIDAFVFLWAYLISLCSFVVLFSICIWLLTISYRTCIKPFHYIACLGLFPIFGGFLIIWFIFKMSVYQIEMKRKYSSRFEKDFLPEEFVEPLLGGLNEENLHERKITTSFTKAHYDKFYSKKKRDFLKELHEKLGRMLS